jgi:hypothetical protein
MMRVSIRTVALPITIAIGLMAGSPPALAQASAQGSAQAPPSAEQVRLGIQFSEQMLSVVDFKGLLTQQMTASLAGKDGEIFKAEPKWRDFVIEAMNDEFTADHAAIVAVMGRALARNFSADELQVGLAVFRDPAMPVAMKAMQAGQPAPPGVNLQTATLQALTTPAGRSFAAKFSNIAPLLEGAKDDLARVLIPGFFQRFGEKAVALERQRRKAEGLPPVGG